MIGRKVRRDLLTSIVRQFLPSHCPRVSRVFFLQYNRSFLSTKKHRRPESFSNLYGPSDLCYSKCINSADMYTNWSMYAHIDLISLHVLTNFYICINKNALIWKRIYIYFISSNWIFIDLSNKMLLSFHFHSIGIITTKCDQGIGNLFPQKFSTFAVLCFKHLDDFFYKIYE